MSIIKDTNVSERKIVKMNKPRYGLDFNAPFILALMAVSLVVLLIDLTPINMVSLFGAYRTSFASPMQYVRLFTHIIVHADLSHFAGNFMMILAIGPMVEEKYGSKTLLILTVITAVVTGLINVIFWPGRAVVGASGIVFMLILLASFTNIRQGKIPITVPLVAVLYIGNEILLGLFTTDNISGISHIIGGLCGAVFGLVLNSKKLK